MTKRQVLNTDNSFAYYQILDKKGNVIGHEDANGNPIEVNSVITPELKSLVENKKDERRKKAEIQMANDNLTAAILYGTEEDIAKARAYYSDIENRYEESGSR